MTVIRRTIPKSNPGRRIALRQASDKNTAAGTNTVLTPDTATRLGSIYPLYKTAGDALPPLEAASRESTSTKDLAGDVCYMYSADFLDAVMRAVKRGEMPKSVLAFYGLDQSSPTLPPSDTDQQVVDAGEAVITGETARVAAGGTPLPMPTKAQVQQKLDDYTTALAARNAAAEALQNGQQALNDLNEKADGVIKKVWDEADTHFNEETDESRRASCRLWGVVYVSDTRISITGVMVTIANNEAVGIAGNLLLAESNETTKSKGNGSFELKSGYTGMATLIFSAEGFASKTITHNIDGNGDIDLGEITLLP